MQNLSGGTRFKCYPGPFSSVSYGIGICHYFAAKSTDNDMEDKNITFEDLPKAMSWMMDKLNKLDSKIDGLNNIPQIRPADQWMNLKELCEYLPSHPAEQTVYGWTSCHQIPFHKRGKRIMFLKSEIDAWLHDGKRKSQKELAEEAAQFINAKRNRPF